MEPEGSHQERRNHTSDILAGAEGPARALALPGEGLMRSMVQHSSDIMALLSEDGTIRYASPAVEGVLGYPPDDVVGSKVLSYVHPEDVGEASSALLEGVRNAGKGLPPVEFRARAVDG